jgi:hypothetical protein
MINVTINGQCATIDEKTAVGFNVQSFNLSNPESRKVSTSNNFQIPRARNEGIFEFAAMPGSTSEIPYDEFEVSVSVDGLLIFDRDPAYITHSDADYYYIVVYKRSPLIDEMKATELDSFLLATHFNQSWTTIIKSAITATTELKMDIIGTEWLRDTAPSTDHYYHFIRSPWSYFIKSIFDKYEVLTGVTFNGDLFDDYNFDQLRMIVRKAVPYRDSSSINGRVELTEFMPGKTMWDLFQLVLKSFCAIMSVDGTTITINTFNGLDLNDTQDWSGLYQGHTQKGYAIPKTNQINDLGQKMQNGAVLDYDATIRSNNKTLPARGKLVDIGTNVYPLEGYEARIPTRLNGPLLTIPEYRQSSLTSSVGIQLDPQVNDFIFIVHSDYVFLDESATIYLYFIRDDAPGSVASNGYSLLVEEQLYGYVARNFNPLRYYLKWGKFLNRSVTYNAQVRLDVVDLVNFDPNKPVSIDRLGSPFWVNKIDGWNVSKGDKVGNAQLLSSQALRDPELFNIQNLNGEIVDAKGNLKFTSFGNTDPFTLSTVPCIRNPNWTGDWKGGVEMLGAGDINTYEPFSFSFWLYRTSSTGFNFIFNQAAQPAYYWGPNGNVSSARLIVYASGSSLIPSIYDSNGKYRRRNGGSLGTFVWQHFVITGDGGTASSGVKLYKDLVSVGTAQSDGFDGSPAPALDPIMNAFQFGYTGTNQLYYTNFLRWFNYELTLSEITDIRNAEKGHFGL